MPFQKYFGEFTDRLSVAREFDEGHWEGDTFIVSEHFPSDDQIVVACPVCGGRMTRQPAAPAFALKGPGWFRTDYDTGDRHRVEE